MRFLLFLIPKIPSSYAAHETEPCELCTRQDPAQQYSANVAFSGQVMLLELPYRIQNIATVLGIDSITRCWA